MATEQSVQGNRASTLLWLMGVGGLALVIVACSPQADKAERDDGVTSLAFTSTTSSTSTTTTDAGDGGEDGDATPSTSTTTTDAGEGGATSDAAIDPVGAFYYPCWARCILGPSPNIISQNVDYDSCATNRDSAASRGPAEAACNRAATMQGRTFETTFEFGCYRLPVPTMACTLPDAGAR